MSKPLAEHPRPNKTISKPARAFRTKILVRFRDCDPAGIVFYPRYMEMFNNLVEDWFREGLELSFPELISTRGWGVPTVHVNVDFFSPSRIGETLNASLGVRRLGRSSIHLEIVFTGPDDSDRVRAKVVLVLSDLGTMRARAIPDDLRAQLARYSLPVLEDKIHADSPTTRLGAA